MYTWRKGTSVSVRILHEEWPSEVWGNWFNKSRESKEPQEDNTNEARTRKDQIKKWFKEKFEGKRVTWQIVAMENEEKSKDRESFGDTATAERAKTLKDATATDKSKILTHVYEKMMKIFRTKWLPEKEVINLSWEFMKQNGAKIQKDIQEHSDPDVIQKNIGIQANQFLATVGTSMANKKYDLMLKQQKLADYWLPPTKLSTSSMVVNNPVDTIELAPPEINASLVSLESMSNVPVTNTENPDILNPIANWNIKDWESQEIPDEWSKNTWNKEIETEKEIFSTYAENRERNLDFIAENHFNPNETPETLSDPSRHLQHMEDIPDNSMRDHIIDSPSAIAGNIKSLDFGKTELFDFPFEWWVTEMALTRQANGDILCQGSDNIEIRISSGEDPENMLKYYSEIMRTPIVRRLLMGWIAPFTKLRKKFAQENSIADTNPEAFIDMALLALRSKVMNKMKESGQQLDPNLMSLWDALPDRVNKPWTLASTQSFLLVHRSDFLESLRIARILPESGVQKIDPKLLLPKFP